MAVKKQVEAEKETGERWLLTYADMITLLLALFVVLYAISSIDAQKYAAIQSAMTQAFEGSGSGSGNGSGSGSGQGEAGFPDSPQALPGDIASLEDGQNNHFSELYKKLVKEVDDSGLSGNITVVQDNAAIIVRFRDSVLFLPDKAEMKTDGLAVLGNISNIISGMGDSIGHIQIEGHTAFVGEESDQSYEAWDLSAARAVAVLRYLNQNGVIGQGKMNIAGYSHFVPVASNDTEEGRSQNRRVELRISPPETP